MLKVEEKRNSLDQRATHVFIDTNAETDRNGDDEENARDGAVMGWHGEELGEHVEEDGGEDDEADKLPAQHGGGAPWCVRERGIHLLPGKGDGGTGGAKNVNVRGGPANAMRLEQEREGTGLRSRWSSAECSYPRNHNCPFGFLVFQVIRWKSGKAP